MQYDRQDFLETAAPGTLALIARTRSLTRSYNQTDYEDKEKKTAILRELVGSLGENVEIDTPLHCDYGKNIFIGSNVIINMNCTFVDNRPIRIGNQVLIASNVQIYTSGHPLLPQERLVADWKEKGTTCMDRRRCDPSSRSDDRKKQRHRGRKRRHPLHS